MKKDINWLKEKVESKAKVRELDGGWTIYKSLDVDDVINSFLIGYLALSSSSCVRAFFIVYFYINE